MKENDIIDVRWAGDIILVFLPFFVITLTILGFLN